MSPDEETSLSDTESVAPAEKESESAPQPMNRAERRAQGKKSTSSGNPFAHPQPTNLRGMTSRAGKSKTMFSRKSGSK